MNSYPKVKRLYRHYKGGTYKVLSLAKHTENDEVLVIYKSQEFGSVHARPLSMWFENVNKDEDSKPVFRFVLIEKK